MCLCLWLNIVFSMDGAPFAISTNQTFLGMLPCFGRSRLPLSLSAAFVVRCYPQRRWIFSLVKNYIDVSLVLCQLKHSGLILFWARRFPSFNLIFNIRWSRDWSQFWHLAILFGLVIHTFLGGVRFPQNAFFIIQFCSDSWPLKRLLHCLARLEDVVASLSGEFGAEFLQRFDLVSCFSKSFSFTRSKKMIYISILLFVFCLDMILVSKNTPKWTKKSKVKFWM